MGLGTGLGTGMSPRSLSAGTGTGRGDGATYKDTVEGRGRPAALHVAQDGDPGVIAQTLHHQLQDGGFGSGTGCPDPPWDQKWGRKWGSRHPAYVFDVVGGDGLAVLVDGALGHDDDVQPRAAQAGLGERWR